MQLVTLIIENYQSGLGLNDKIIRYPGHKYQNRPLQSCAINDMFLRSGKQRETDQAGGICWIAMNADWSVFLLLLDTNGDLGCVFTLSGLSTHLLKMKTGPGKSI